ncbi:YhgE/Pip domain-containing protein [Lentibacillus sp. CBA3610]|uniref:YhgE/Pip domain-containing protein n=1 Tax=Lentibacillus sp. CBA3610 TaxID=2518176 RepID=UPI0015952495|nr:YhgE/Pip domain-containing protein [Lentibacillus sp. CBA3610]QKY70764.1 YhgE/Pip domain-containing protein [Lentibacillus sp. CBA3610]
MRPKKLAIMMMCAVLVFGSLPLPALAENNAEEESGSGEYDAKDETIYGNLNTSGTLQDMYVVNTFHVTEPGEIVDYGDYTNVRNLSNLTDIEQNDGEVRVQAEEGEFYYQGDMDNQPLPWNIDITYILDGEEVAPDELAGKSGELEIQIATSANESVDTVFFEHYMMQISLTVDPSIFDDIQAPDGTEATSGKNKQITFTVMPEQEEEFIVSANVTDFEMDPIDISATPASMPMEEPDLGGMKGDMQSLSDAISEVNSGVSELNSGISDLNEGAADLSSGSAEYLSGISDLDQSSGELVSGSAEIRDVLQNVNDAVQDAPDTPDISELEALPGGMRELAGDLQESADGLDELSDNYNQAYGNLDDAISGIPDDDITDEQFAELRNSNADEEVVDQLIGTYEAAHTAKQTYLGMQEMFGSVTGTLDQISGSMREMADRAETIAGEIESGMENMNELDALGELQSGVSTMASQYQTFHSGLVEYTGGVSELASSYEELNTGIQELSDGTSSLDSGASELQDGTEELQDQTSNLPGQMQSEVDDMMDEYDASDFEPQSFVSDENENVDVVQFVLSTESIEVEEPETTDESEEEEPSFWDRLMDLFR